MASSISKTQDLKELRQILHQSVDELLLELENDARKPPSLDELNTDTLLAPPVAESARQSIVRACEKLTALAQGPMGWMMQSAGGHVFPAVLNTALELRLHQLVSTDVQSPSTLRDLAKDSGGSQELISRLLRYLTQRYVFREVSPGLYLQNANSIILKLPGVEALMGLCSDDIFRAGSALSSTMKENDFKVDNRKSAFSRAFQTDLESFDYYYKQDPDRGRRFSLGMTPFTGSYASSLALYPFQDLQPGALIVDVGGGSGHVSSEIAKANPKLKFIVQDLEGPILLGRSTYKDSGLPIEWQIHNAFHPQPVMGADVYFMRRVLHDHSDAIGANILKMICEAMDQKSRILIEDMIAPDLHGEDSECAFFGPLSKFPGPKYRAFSNIFEIWSIVNGTDNIDRPALHRKYGPIVRVAPSVLSFAGGDGVWKDIHGFNVSREGGIIKEPVFYSKIFAFTDVSNLITARDHSIHARQRKVLARSFSNTALIDQQPIFHRWAEKFVDKLAGKAGAGNTIDMVKYFNCTTFDIMGDLTFNEDLNMLEEGECSPWVESIFGSVKAATFLLGVKTHSRAARLLADAFLKYNPAVQRKQIENWMYCAERVERRLKREPKHPDLWSRILGMEKESESLTMEEQYANGFLFMTAGTETIASALSAITFYLLQNPRHLEKVTKEVRLRFSTSEDMSLEALASLPYLQAVIQEGLRLHPPLPIMLPRVIPKGGARVAGEWIPGGTIVGIHFLSMHTQKLYFKKPLEFHPQRWLRDPEFENDQLDMAKPFLMGPFNCIGKV
ncbi:Cytochrome P450 monooxygenase hmp1 [Colletotrichum fructicola]|nr:Cytochrome P450 monooxygenase hmp1 [Colletotrichum fructicola]